jgi:hypothetical protein
VSVLLIVLACLLAPFSVVSAWARGAVTDTDRYLATVAPLAEDPAIQQAVANRVNTAIFEAIDLEQLTQEAIATVSDNRELNERQIAVLNTLGGALDSGIRSFVGDTVNRVIQSDQFAQLWAESNTRLHSQLNAALMGQREGAVSLQNDQIVLDVGAVVSQVKEQLIAQGFSVAERIPVVQNDLVLFESNSLVQVQTGYRLLDAIGYWLPLIAISLALIGVFANTNPRKAFVGFGVGLALAMMVGAVGLALLRLTLLNELPPGSSAAAVTALFDQLTYFLREALRAGAVAGAVLVLAGLLTGPARFAAGVRSLAVKGAGSIHRALVGWGVPLKSVGPMVANQARGLRLGATLVTIAVVMFQPYKTASLILWAVFGLIMVLFIIQIVASPGSEGVQNSKPDGAPKSDGAPKPDGESEEGDDSEVSGDRTSPVAAEL